MGSYRFDSARGAKRLPRSVTALIAGLLCATGGLVGVASAPPAGASTAPIITSAAQTSVAAKSPLTFVVTTASDSPTAIRAKHLPKWLTLTDNADGTAGLTGTPPRPGTAVVQLVATNADGKATQALTITVFTVAKFISTNRTLDAPGELVYVAVNATGYPTPAFSSADLPAWASLTDNGDGSATLQATPPTVGTFTFTLTATNIGGSTDQLFTLRVKKGVIGRPALPDVTWAGTYDMYVTWAGHPTALFPFTLNADHTGSDAFGDVVTWKKALHNITITFTGNGATATYLGKRTKNGFNTKTKQGTSSSTTGASGTWYAQY